MACMPVEVVPLGEVSQASLEEAISEASSRQNQFVLFEFGLFVGKLTRKRAFIVRSSTVSLPSDLAGINTAGYDPTAPNLTAAVGPACQGIRAAIEHATSTAAKSAR
jgi:predicted nucleotide-binding protein